MVRMWPLDRRLHPAAPRWRNPARRHRRIFVAASPASASLKKKNPAIAAHVAPILRAGIILALSALAPLIPWTLRNLHTLHRFEPLAPRYANDSDEPS